MKTKFKIGDCVKFQCFSGGFKVGIIEVIAPWRRRGKLKIGIKSNDILYSRNDNEIYPITEDQYLIAKLEQ